MDTACGIVPGRHRLWAVLGTLAVLLLAACGRLELQPAGVPVQEPRLTGDHAVMADGYRLPLHRWEPAAAPQAVVLALHGFGDHGRAFGVLRAPLVDSGLAIVYAYDQRGFGATFRPGIWAGWETLVGDLRAMVSLLRRAHPDLPLYLVGESMGGAVVLVALAGDPAIVGVAGAVLLAPAVWGPRAMPWYQWHALRVLHRVAPAAVLTGDAVADLGIRPTDDLDVLRALREDPLVQKSARVDTLYGVTRLMGEAMDRGIDRTRPVLVLYGLNDQVIPPGPVCEWLGGIERADAGRLRIVLYPGGYHMLTRYSGAGSTFDDVAAWIRDPEATLPAGEEFRPEEAKRRVCTLPPRGRRGR